MTATMPCWPSSAMHRPIELGTAVSRHAEAAWARFREAASTFIGVLVLLALLPAFANVAALLAIGLLGAPLWFVAALLLH